MSRGAARMLLAAALSAWLALPLPAAALTLNPGQVLEAPFSLLGPAAGADTLTFRLVNVSAVDVTTMTVELYDGATLLGSVSNVPVNGIAAFTDTGSLWTENKVSADLASVRAGTIVGRVRVLPDFGPASTLTADVSPITSFAVGHGSNAATITPIADTLVVGTPQLVPEPGAAALLVVAAALCGVRRRR